jgi:hypothetical protein
LKFLFLKDFFLTIQFGHPLSKGLFVRVQFESAAQRFDSFAGSGGRMVFSFRHAGDIGHVPVHFEQNLRVNFAPLDLRPSCLPKTSSREFIPPTLSVVSP